MMGIKVLVCFVLFSACVVNGVKIQLPQTNTAGSQFRKDLSQVLKSLPQQMFPSIGGLKKPTRGGLPGGLVGGLPGGLPGGHPGFGGGFGGFGDIIGQALGGGPFHPSNQHSSQAFLLSYIQQLQNSLSHQSYRIGYIEHQLYKLKNKLEEQTHSKYNTNRE